MGKILYTVKDLENENVKSGFWNPIKLNWDQVQSTELQQGDGNSMAFRTPPSLCPSILQTELLLKPVCFTLTCSMGTSMLKPDKAWDLSLELG